MATIKQILVYTKAALNALVQRPAVATLIYAGRYAAVCLNMADNGMPELPNHARPWMCFPALEFLDRALKGSAKIFEYGSGASTIYFGRRVREVVSVEHNPEWYKRVCAAVASLEMQNVHCMLIEPGEGSTYDRSRVSDPHAYISDDETYAGRSFQAYACSIDQYPDSHFDLVVVDGRSRPSCLMHAIPKVRVGGILLLDQSERSYYLVNLPALRDRKRWTKVRFMAPLPYSLHFTEATFFTKVRV